MQEENVPVINMTMTVIAGISGIVAHIVGGFTETIHPVRTAPLVAFERTVKNEKSVYLPALQRIRRLERSNSRTWTLCSILWCQRSI